MDQAIQSDEDRRREISRILVDARRRAGFLPGFPGALPKNLAEAYKVQAVSRDQWLDPVIGWKVGGIPPKHREGLGADRLCGPIFAKRFVAAVPGEVSTMAVFAEGFAAIELEFVLKLGLTPSEDRLFIGAEIASSPIVKINDVGPLAVVCDFGNNHGVLVGPEIGDWRGGGMQNIPVTADIDGQRIGEKIVLDLPSCVAPAREFLVAHCERQGIDLPPGTLISTGAITGVHEAACGTRSVLRFGDLGTLELRLCAAEPES